MIPGDGAVRKHSRKACSSFTEPCRPLDLLANGGGIEEVPEFGLRCRSVLHAAALGKALHQYIEEFRKFFIVTPAAPLRFAGEAGHALRHVGLKAHALLFAVVPDVDSGVGLLPHHVTHGAVQLVRELRRVDAASPSRRTSRSDSASLRGRLPTWVMRIRSLLLIIGVPSLGTARRAIPGRAAPGVCEEIQNRTMISLGPDGRPNFTPRSSLSFRVAGTSNSATEIFFVHEPVLQRSVLA